MPKSSPPLPERNQEILQGMRLILAGFVRGRLLEEWKRILPEDGTLPERLNVSMRTIDPRDGALVLIAAEQGETGEFEPREVRVHPDGFGHVDLAWRVRRSLYVQSLLYSTRSQGVLGSHDDGAGETFIAPVGDALDHLPVVIYARLRRGGATTAERTATQCEEMLTALDNVARIVCAPVQAVLQGLASGDIRLDARGLQMAPITVEHRTPESILSRMATQLLEGPFNHEQIEAARAIGAVVGFRLSSTPSGPVLRQQQAVVDQDRLSKLWMRHVQRAIFERADSRVGTRIEKYASGFDRGAPARFDRSPGTGIVSDEIHPSLAIHEAFTTLYHLPVVDGDGALQAIFNLNVDRSTPLPEAWENDLQRGIDRLTRLGDAFHALRPDGSRSCPFVVTDIAADILRQITRELTRRQGDLGRTLYDIHENLLGLSGRWRFPDDGRLKAAAQHLLDEKLLQGLRTLRSVCAYGVLVSGWIPLYAFRLRRVRDRDDIRVVTPEAPAFATADPLTDRPARLFTQRREVAPLVRLMTSMAAQARVTGACIWPIRRHRGARKDDHFYAVEVEDGTTHIVAPMERGDPFPYQSCALQLGDGGDAALVLSGLEASVLAENLGKVVGAAADWRHPPVPGHYLVTTWSRGHFDLATLSGVEGQLSAHQARVWKNAGAERPRRLAAEDMTIFQHASGVALPLDRVRQGGRFSPGFESLLQHVEGTRSEPLDDTTRACALDLLGDVPAETGQDAGSGGDGDIVARVAPFARLLAELGSGFRGPDLSRLGAIPAGAPLGFYGPTSLARVVYLKPIANARSQPVGLLLCLGTARRPRSPTQALPAFGRDSPERDLVDRVVTSYRDLLPAPVPWSVLRDEIEGRVARHSREQQKVLSAVQAASGEFTPTEESFPSEIRDIWLRLLQSAPASGLDDWEGYLRFVVLMTCLLNATSDDDTRAEVLGIRWDAWRKSQKTRHFVTALKSVAPKIAFGSNIRFSGRSD